jgi:hypothetical protein
MPLLEMKSEVHRRILDYQQQLWQSLDLSLMIIEAKYQTISKKTV